MTLLDVLRLWSLFGQGSSGGVRDVDVSLSRVRRRLGLVSLALFLLGFGGRCRGRGTRDDALGGGGNFGHVDNGDWNETGLGREDSEEEMLVRGSDVDASARLSFYVQRQLGNGYTNSITTAFARFHLAFPRSSHQSCRLVLTFDYTLRFIQCVVTQMLQFELLLAIRTNSRCVDLGACTAEVDHVLDRDGQF